MLLQAKMCVSCTHRLDPRGRAKPAGVARPEQGQSFTHAAQVETGQRKVNAATNEDVGHGLRGGGEERESGAWLPVQEYGKTRHW